MVWPAGGIDFERRWVRLLVQRDAGNAHESTAVKGHSSLDGFASYGSINQAIVSINHIGAELVFSIKPLQSPIDDVITIHPSGSTQFMKSHRCHRILMHRINLKRFHDLRSIHVIQPRPPAVSTLEICELLCRHSGTFA